MLTSGEVNKVEFLHRQVAHGIRHAGGRRLHAVLFGAAQTAPVQARTPDGKIFTVSAVMPTPSGLVLALGR
jgi:hypothetical protein